MKKLLLTIGLFASIATYATDNEVEKTDNVLTASTNTISTTTSSSNSNNRNKQYNNT